MEVIARKYILIMVAAVLLSIKCNNPSKTTSPITQNPPKLSKSGTVKEKADNVSPVHQTVESHNINQDTCRNLSPENINGSFIMTKESRIEHDYLIDYSNYACGYRDSVVTVYQGRYDRESVNFEKQVISLQGDEMYAGVFVWEKVRDSVQLVNILDFTLYSGSMMSNRIDTIIRVTQDKRMIFGKRVGGDEQDLYETFWIGLWSGERSFEIVYFYNMSSSPIQGTDRFSSSQLSYQFKAKDKAIEIQVLNTTYNREHKLIGENVFDTILRVEDLLPLNRSMEFNNTY